MTLREEILTVARGGVTDRVPFTCYKGLAPEAALEIENLALVASAPAFRAELPDITQTATELSPGVRETRMETPWGILTQVAHVETGYGSAWTREHWVKTPDDYLVLEQVLRHTRIVPDPAPLRAALHDMGDRGVVLAWMHRAPFQRLWIEYTGMERLAFDMADHPEAVEGVLDALLEQSREIMRITAQCEAQLAWVPDNITGEMTGPRLFERYMAPYYREVCDTLLPAGKLPCTHMDGMLRQIAESIAATPLPLMEAFTPPPDGNLSVREARARWPEKALWLNFPSSVHLSPPEEIMRVTEGLVEEAADRRGFLVGVTENIPASVGARSLEAIGRALR